MIAETAKGPIEYRLEGIGPTVVVLNGGHCSRESRFSHEKLAACGFSVLTPSRPGYDSTPSSVGETARTAADAIALLLDQLQISTVDMIGISAAGPTALAFAQQHSERLRKLVLESAIATAWDEPIKRRSRLLFGRTQRLTWAVTRLALKLAPKLTVQTMMRELTTLPVKPVMQQMGQHDFRFICQMLKTSQSGTGFMNDIEHYLDSLDGITAPTLVMYSPHDSVVLPKHAKRIAASVKNCECYEVPADSHLIWIGRFSKDVWYKRLSFLSS
ncbi:alpha/beta fold hydrolase [cf. Phormidesmis sp. LEGE 11477]|uniref:alpha/beta fold hydrolase n=1 Tax=cf. Phormidesmis sp. LEGE 11477 TaxID=1828680 RepID=UPI0018812CCE|nr:alpha/beta hydrolase [cf. Phormidesmis sp. LEGE 11477]MBE9063170.1 alpha/beta hydrolase [cf. Phormidesmis sp. LEGE 11477]